MTVLIASHGVKRHFSTLSWTQRLFRIQGHSVKAVDGVSLNIAKGEIVGLVGESGCGKTTLGWLLAGLEQPDEGEIRFRNSSLENIQPDVRKKVQLLFQNPKESLNPRKDVRSILSYPVKKMGYKSPAEINSRIRDLLEMVGLSALYADRYSFQLSGGELQRVALARTLALEPEFIVCDEPTSSVDMNVKVQVLKLLSEISREKGISLLFISHDLGAVRFVADRICVMYLGRIVEEGPPKQLFERPLHPYTKALLDAIAEIDPGKKRTISLQGQPPSPVDPPSGCRFHPRCAYKEKVGSRCWEEEPKLRSDSGDGLVRCFLYSEVSAEPDHPLLQTGLHHAIS